MVLGIKPYKIYMDENGYRYSCRVGGCSGGDGSWELRAVADSKAKEHFDEKHAEHDKEFERWISGLRGDES